MIKSLLTRMRQGTRTIEYPRGPAPAVPEQFRGMPALAVERCGPDECAAACRGACPTEALRFRDGRLEGIDLGRCLFCTQCRDVCERSAISFTREFRLAARNREHLFLTAGASLPLAEPLEHARQKLFRRSLKLRQVSAGGCNACEADVNVLGTIGWDLSRFGIQMVASPRHADGLLVTGCVTGNMKEALQKTYDAVPAPKLVIAVGACAISGGPFYANPEQCGGAEYVVPVDLFIPGCPPHPLTILHGLLRLLGASFRE